MSKEVKETARQRRARTSKFNSRNPHAREGSFELVAMFHGNATPQSAPFNNLGAAIGRLQRLMTNPDLRVVKIIEHTTLRDAKGNQSGKKADTIHQFVCSSPQEFADGKAPWWETHRESRA